MHRELTTHKINGCNDALDIEVMDELGPGGAHHHYRTLVRNPAYVHVTDICFQNGPIAEVGTNGLTHEALLAIVIDRLQAFQRGPFSCRENALALTKVEEAMMWLKARTEARLRRGVEGTLTP